MYVKSITPKKKQVSSSAKIMVEIVEYDESNMCDCNAAVSLDELSMKNSICYLYISGNKTKR